MKLRFFLWLWLVAVSSVAAAEQSGKILTSVQRLEREHLQAANEARLNLARGRQTLTNFSIYEDFRAVLVRHADELPGGVEERAKIVEAARKSGARIVMFAGQTGADAAQELRDGLLIMSGIEEQGIIRFPNYDKDRKALPTGELRFLTRFGESDSGSSFDGVVICNTATQLDPGFRDYLTKAMNDSALRTKLADNFKTFPDEFFAAGTSHRLEPLARWDRESQKRVFTGIAANDLNGGQFLKEQDSFYEVSLRHVSTHVLAQELTEPEIRKSLREGRVYVSYDWLGDPAGFTFLAINNLGVFEMGDSAPMSSSTRLTAQTPIPAHLKLIYQGAIIDETNGTRLTFSAKEAGAYRLEAWLKVADEERPWIYSNPIRLEKPSLAMLAKMRLPSAELATNVVAKKDIVYFEGKPEDEAKHKLDLYLPQNQERAPVFLFIHGGAWRAGDRSQYPSVANRFAKAGILVAVMSYRLAPKNPHPAQIEDTAAAFAWVHRHISEYGGDTNRIYVGGHSAGGHLAALLALDERYLEQHHLSAGNIRGVISLSGVFDVNDGSRESRVFGSDAEIKKAASPINHVRSSAPPFLITYCQWDYLTLPAQARRFHAALRRAGVASDLVYIAKESHISEMFAISNENDPSALAILKFILNPAVEKHAR